MHAYKKALLSVALSFLLPFSAMSADEDGTFTITIQGPEVEDTVPQVQPVQPASRAPVRRAAPRQNRQATVNATATRAPAATATRQPQTESNATSVQQTPARTYSVASGDTIWSVAHRYLPQDRSVNEFQIVASIYRHNRGAFGRGNVNNLLRTTITIPPVSEIARETTDTGSRLLAQGSMTLPPLGNAPATVNTQATLNNTATPAPATQASKPMQSLSDNDIPQYTATETKIKKLQEEADKKDLSVAMPENTRGADLDKSQVTEKTVPNGNNEGSADNNKKAEAAKAMSADLAAAAVDAQSIRIMLDGNKKAIDEKTKVLEQQLAEAMDRMKKTSAATAKTAADSVSTLASQYDNIISGLQQDIIEIKGNISKISQDNDRMREMLLANDEKIEDMQLQLSKFSVSTPTSVVDLDKPVMMILFGAGLLALVLMIVFLIIKLKSRASAKMTDDFDVEDDYSSDDTLLSDENGSIDLEAPVSGDEEPDTTDIPQRELDKNNNSINSPSDSASDVETALNEKKQADAEESASNATEIPDNSATADNTGADATATEKDPAQEAWDNAATTNSSDEIKDDKDVMDEWSKALDEQTGSEKNVDLDKDENKDTSQDDMASAWEAALNEHENSENQDDDKAKSDDESMADAWSAALNEQKEAEEKTEDKANASKSEEEAMADAWSAALNEQKEAEEKTEDKANASKSEEEAMADAWSAALNDQKEAEEKTEDKANAPKSEEDPVADATAQESVTEKTSSKENREAEDTAPKSEEEAITEAMNKAYENADSAKESETSDVATDVTDNADIDSIVDDADKETVAEQENTAESTPSDETESKEESSATDDILADEVKVEDVSEDELLNHLKDNSDKILEENHVDPETLDIKAESSQAEISDNVDADASDVAEPLDASNKTEDDAEPSKEEPVSSEDPQEQLSGEEKAFLESMSDNKNSDNTEDEKAEIDAEFENNDPKEDNIPEADAEEISDDEVPKNNSVGKNVDEVLNDDLNLEDLLIGNDNVVDAPEEAESPEEIADGVETFDAIPEDEEKQKSEHTIDEDADPHTDAVEPENAETVDAEPVDTDEADYLDNEAVEPEFEVPEQDDSFDETPVEEAMVTSADEDTADTTDVAKSENDDTNDIGDIQDKSEQAIFNPDPQDDNSKDENGVVSWAVPDDDFDIVGKVKDPSATTASDTVEDTPQNEDTLSNNLEETIEQADVATDANDDALESKENDSPAENVESLESQAEDAKALDDLEQRLSASKAQYDSGADEDIMNMLSGGVHDDLPHDNEKAFTDDEIASMMSSANAVDPKSIPEDDLALNEPVEDKSSDPDDTEDHSLENVADTIGPISSQSDDVADDNNLGNAENSDDYEGLNAKQHQYYVDELNLARLYFETGDTEEALKIIDDVKEHGSSDLKEEASKIIETYGN
ncbi:MAG: FimV/HubP family polar landmark protein [Succinivibrio sp.]|nr:FimV/HubP family polar landmark protein [Succinivibrio sp.]